MPESEQKTRSRTARNSRRSSGAAPSFGIRLRKRIFRPGPLLVMALVGGALILRPQIHRWSNQLQTRPEYQVSLENIQVTRANQWVPIDLVSQVIAGNDLPDAASLLDKRLLPDVAEAFAKHPWVRRVIRVRASRHGLVVDLDYRRPVAMVETGRGLYPIDAEGVLLPPADFAVSDAARLPLVQNVRTMPQGPAGTEWGDPVVEAAARLAGVLAPGGDLFAYWDRFSLRSIVAPDRRTADPDLEDFDFELLTTGGSRIVWGQVPGADELEPPVQQKLERLDDYLATYGSFERPRGPIRIDIREYEVITLESLENSELPRNARVR